MSESMLPGVNRVKEILDGRYRQYLEKTTQQHSDSFGQGPPVFVEYYHVNAASTTDPVLGNADSPVGPDSPYKYTHIREFPLFQFQASYQSLVQGDLGPEDTFDGEAVIIPGSILPVAGDHFSISIVSTVYLFKVTSVGGDRLHTMDKYCKITYVLVSDTLTQINEQVVKHARVYPDKYLQGSGIILEDDNAVSLQIVEMFFEELRQIAYDHTSEYSLPLVNAGFVFEERRPILLELSYLLNKYNLLSRREMMMANIVLHEPWKRGNEFAITRIYHRSFFASFDQGLKDAANDAVTIPEVNNTRFMTRSIYDRFSDRYAHGLYLGVTPGFITTELTNTAGADTIELIPLDLVTRINTNNPYEDDAHILEDILIAWRNEGFQAVITLLKEHTELVPLIVGREDIDLYYLIPCVLLVLENTQQWCRSQIVTFTPT